MSFLKRLFGMQKREPNEMEIVWEALETDPNLEPAVRRYESGFRDYAGEEAGIAALTRIARIPGSWRAQLWLGQHAMHSHQPERALEMFRDCMAKVSRPAPMDVLADISASLGSAGYFREIEELVEPAFEAKIHTIHVGSNLMRAHTEMGQFDKARKILDQLYAFRRPESEGQLKYWTEALANAESS
jgi:tetratricopeptide (TPR) repeat protein